MSALIRLSLSLLFVPNYISETLFLVLIVIHSSLFYFISLALSRISSKFNRSSVTESLFVTTILFCLSFETSSQ